MLKMNEKKRWKVCSDLMGAFPFRCRFGTTTGPHHGQRRDEENQACIVGLTVYWEDNIDDAHGRKMRHYDNLM